MSSRLPTPPHALLAAVAALLLTGCPSADEGLVPPQGAHGPLTGAMLPRDPPKSAQSTQAARGPDSPTAPLTAASTAPVPVAPPEPTPPEPGRANEDPDDDTVVAPPEPIPDCEARLRSAGVEFSVAQLPVHRERGIECGTPQAVLYRRGPRGLRWWPTPVVSCGLALALARFEIVLDEEAERELGTGISVVEQGGTYSCRPMARFRMVSEHSYANAIDLRAFRTQKGQRISVVDHFGKPGCEPATAGGRFLRRLANRLYDDGVFSVVVTRFFDEIHRDHIHVDLARYRVDGSR